MLSVSKLARHSSPVFGKACFFCSPASSRLPSVATKPNDKLIDISQALTFTRRLSCLVFALLTDDAKVNADKGRRRRTRHCPQRGNHSAVMSVNGVPISQ